MKLLVLGFGLFAVSFYYAHTYGEQNAVFPVLIGSAIVLLVIGVPRFIWLKAETIAKIAGGFAAKWANHVDTFKETFKAERR